MAQSKMYTSFSNGEEWAGAELSGRHNPEASVDSLDHSAYQAVHDAIVEAAQASGELQPLTEAEMERRVSCLWRRCSGKGKYVPVDWQIGT